MSDQGRKNFTDKVSESVTPDSQKSTWDKATETATDAYDKVAKTVQPEEEKGIFQKIGDTLTGKQ